MLAHCKSPTNPTLPCHFVSFFWQFSQGIMIWEVSVFPQNTIQWPLLEFSKPGVRLFPWAVQIKKISLCHSQMRYPALALCLLRKEVSNWWCKAWGYTRTLFSRNCQINSNKLLGGRVAEWLGCWTCNLVVLGVSPLPCHSLDLFSVTPSWTPQLHCVTARRQSGRVVRVLDL